MAGLAKSRNAATAGQLKAERARVGERAKFNNTTPAKVVLGHFALVDLVDQNRHQWAMLDRDQAAGTERPDFLLAAPLSPDFTRRYDDRLHYLTQNKESFDDPIEDALAEDPIANSVKSHLRSKDERVAADATDAYRARRLTFALLGHAGLSAARPEKAPAEAATASPEASAEPPELTLTVQLVLDPLAAAKV